MRSAKTVLSIIRDRGTRGLPLKDVYRQLYNRNLFLLAYWKIAKNDGALTPGVDGQTADGMTMGVIDAIIAALRHERYRWDPARRVYIEKKASKTMRPLGIPTWSDRLLQEVIRLILEAYYEPQFSDASHGFRPHRGCGTALQAIHRWHGTTWFIEGDISGCFDTIDHDVLVSILAENIHDNRFLRLIGEGLKAGYLERGVWQSTHRGTPQGGIASPTLANIYLDRLDRFVEDTLLPQHTRGDRRRPNPDYVRATVAERILRKHGRYKDAKDTGKRRRRLPSLDPADETFRRLRYVRYADDFLLGFSGPKAEAEAIKEQVRVFLKDTLRLTLSTGKTLVTHARTERARFLSYEVHTLHDDSQRTQHRRAINGRIGFRVPKDVVEAKCMPYLKNGKPTHLPQRMHDDDFSIVARYQSEYRGTVNYWRMAYNLNTSMGKLKHVMTVSLLKTLAAKHRSTTSKMARKYGATLTTPEGRYKVLQVTVERPGKPSLVATWGGISLRWSKTAPIDEISKLAWNGLSASLLDRLLADTCEVCGSHDDVDNHHVRRLQRGKGTMPVWQRIMIARQRKRIALCARCHAEVHSHDDQTQRRRARRPRRPQSPSAGAG